MQQENTILKYYNDKLQIKYILKEKLEELNSKSKNKIEVGKDPITKILPVLVFSKNNLFLDCPYISECGTFNIENPETYYNLTKEQIDLLNEKSFNNVNKDKLNKKSQLNDVNKDFQITIALNENFSIIEDIEEELFMNGLRNIEGLYIQKLFKLKKEIYENY